MKRALIYILLTVAAILVPVERTDLEKLKPVEAVYLGMEGEQVVICTDTEDMGIGLTLEAALQNLKETTSGIVYLDTADYLLIGPGGDQWVNAATDYIKGTTYVCTAVKGVDMGGAAAFLAVHTPECRLKDWEKGGFPPKLMVENGRYRLE